MAQTLWEKCIDKPICVKLIFKKFCIRIKVCVRVIKDGEDLFIEISGFGHSWRKKLFSGCMTVFTFKIGQLKVCLEAGAKSVRVVLKGCIGVDGISKCWTLLAHDIHWFAISELSAAETEFFEIVSPGFMKFSASMTAAGSGSPLASLGVVDRELEPHEIAAFESKALKLMATADDSDAIEVFPDVEIA